ncbi:caspase family protein [Aquimarina sp. MMG016]|uniref:caspase family protein n=1 Tax=Aquimarina sp. MMG016 TaxID=2822690 RepID=UPI001B3A3B44|nr:caspase family protein [Aquimarina sp. MMG016]MBQ4819454.1 caspase family protein [Aquimarina sp. MMG016]
MGLFALLIGINQYERNPLLQCVNDVDKIETYLDSIQDNYDSFSVKKLIDGDATKTNIIQSINSFYHEVNDDDVVFLYYSGHGTLEESSGLFNDVHSGLIECMVCYDKDQDNDADFLLADKELRYLFSRFPSNPHLVSVFDCCHSGDIVRSFKNKDLGESRSRRMSTIFPARDYEDFIFAKEINEKDFKTNSVAALIPYKNSVNISACLSSESSWEDAKGGVFTRYLLQLLRAKENKINYQEITKWARISLKDITQKKQTPVITIQGDGTIDHYSSWLNLFPKQNKIDQGKIVFNNKNGWFYNKGLLFGIKEDFEIMIQVDENNSFTTKILEVNLEYALIQDPMEQNISLDYNNSYSVISNLIYNELEVYIHNLDQDKKTEDKIKPIISGIPNISVVTADQASFYVNIFNQTIYISLADDPYRPLALQIDLLELEDDQIHKMLSRQLRSLIKWNYYNTLENPDSGFQKPPIKVEICLEDQNWVNIFDKEHTLPVSSKDQKTTTGEYYQKYQVKVSNISNENIFVTVLLLSSDISISSDPFDNLTKELKPGQSILFYDHYNTAYAGWSFDTYKEIYNWEYDWLNYKFIVNNVEDITASIPDMLQDPLKHPITTELRVTRGHGPISEFSPKEARWGVYTTSLKLPNPVYNQVSKKLLDNWNWYTNHRITKSFIDILYPNQKKDNLIADTFNT